MASFDGYACFKDGSDPPCIDFSLSSLGAVPYLGGLEATPVPGEPRVGQILTLRAAIVPAITR
eukprot:2833348-Pyramimonas_sp.AAC.1